MSAAVSNEDNDTPTLVGFGVRAGLIAAAAGSVVGQGAGVGARYLQASVLVMCAIRAIRASSSSELTGLLVLAVVGWLWFWWCLRTEQVRGWIQHRAPSGE